MDAYLAFPVGFGRLEPGLGVGVDVMFVASTEEKQSEDRPIALPGGRLGLAWSLPLPHDIFVRAHATGGVYQPYNVLHDANSKTLAFTIFETPLLRLELGLEFGLWFW
jgi:hypothetical protein